MYEQAFITCPIGQLQPLSSPTVLLVAFGKGCKEMTVKVVKICSCITLQSVVNNAKYCNEFRQRQIINENYELLTVYSSLIITFDQLLEKTDRVKSFKV